MDCTNSTRAALSLDTCPNCISDTKGRTTILVPTFPLVELSTQLKHCGFYKLRENEDWTNTVLRGQQSASRPLAFGCEADLKNFGGSRWARDPKHQTHNLHDSSSESNKGLRIIYQQDRYTLSAVFDSEGNACERCSGRAVCKEAFRPV